MSSQTTPLTLASLPPELIESILTYLCQADLALCVRVCRSWNDALTPFLWHTLAIVSHEQISRFVVVEAQRAFLRNAVFVRELFLSRPEMYIWLLPSRISYMLGANVAARPEKYTTRLLTNLQSLELHPPIHPGRELDQDAVAFIQQNPGIRHLVIRVIMGSHELLGLVAWHLSNLQHFNLDSPWSGDVKRLLAALPECIRTIRLSSVSHVASQPCHISSCSTSVGVGTVMNKHAALESFYIQGKLAGQEDDVLVPFFESCSRNLQWVDGLGSTFFQSTMIVNALLKIGFQWKVLQEHSLILRNSDAFAAEVISRSDHWTCIQQLAPRVGPLTAAAIVEHGQHLEILEVKGGRTANGRIGVLGSHVQALLSKATRLRTLRIDWLVESQIITAMEILGSAWATTLLQDLCLKIHVPRVNNESSSNSTEHQSSRSIQRLVLRRLGQQKHLSRLILGGTVMAPLTRMAQHQSNCLELTLESGLDELAGLKALEILDIGGMDHRVGVPELEWMIDNWPKLRL
ncbi:hypothetical protein BGZ73_005026, partial [Actinomortierella ambigua]